MKRTFGNNIIKGILCGMLMFVLNARAQPIEFIVSASAGGPNDQITRKIVDVLERESDLKFVVINRPGAGHTIAYNHISSSNKPLLFISTPDIESHPVIQSLDDIFTLGSFYNIMFVSEKSGIRTFDQFIKLANSREIIFANGGIGSYSYMAMEKVCQNIRCLSVPYKSGSEGMLAIMSGQADAYALVSYGAKQFQENDKLVSIADVKLPAEKSWLKMFSKNITTKDRHTIVTILSKQDKKFYKDMGL